MVLNSVLKATICSVARVQEENNGDALNHNGSTHDVSSKCIETGRSRIDWVVQEEVCQIIDSRRGVTDELCHSNSTWNYWLDINVECKWYATNRSEGVWTSHGRCRFEVVNELKKCGTLQN
jgi:hypothetical protein